jgi:hypothetical protein
MTTLAVPYSKIPAKPVHWLHEGFVPFRHVTVVVGQGGTSKGICTLDYAARLTRGDPMPGEAEPSYEGPMDVIVILPEDDPNEAVAGRLEGAGAAADRVHNLTVFPDGTPFTVQHHIAAIGQAIDQIEDPEQTPPAADGKPRTVGMVIMDPLLALSENDLRTRGQARPVMEALEHVAKNRHLVIFLTHHTNADGKAASSKAIVETARNVITLSRQPKAADDDPVRILTVSKSNIGITGLSLKYALAGTIETPSVVWACELPPDDTASRGYEIAEPELVSPGPDADTIPVPAVHGNGVQAANAAQGNGIAPAERYRATYMVSTGAGDRKPKVINDYPTPDAAGQACEFVAHSALTFKPTGQPGMVGAVVRNGSTATYYAVLDRYAQQVSQAA